MEPLSHPTGSADGTKTVLFIEGNLASLDLVEAVLARLPHVRVMPTMQGRRGLELAQTHLPSLILLDLSLPDLDSVQLLRQLQADSRTSSIPVITLGRTATSSLAAYLVEIGARAHLTQPLDVGRLLGLVQSALA